MNPTSSFSQSRIAAIKNEESTALAHPPTTPIPHTRQGMGWSEGVPGHYWPPNLILMQSLQLKYTCGKQCPLHLPYILFSILSSIILCLCPTKFEELISSSHYFSKRLRTLLLNSIFSTFYTIGLKN